MALDEGMDEEARAHLQGDAEVGGHASGLFEVVDLPRQRDVRKRAWRDFQHRGDMVFADHRVSRAGFPAVGREEDVLDRFHFGR